MKFACLLLLLSVGLAHCQNTYPRAVFQNQILSNHSYVDVTRIGGGDEHSLQCQTDLSTCCSRDEGVHRGDWYFPNGRRLQFNADLSQRRYAQRVTIEQYYYYDENTLPLGIYRCDIPTIAIHDNNIRESFYVGLYPPNAGSVSINGSLLYDSNTMILTCVSTGGPVTDVTWTRDSVLLTEETNTVMNDSMTAHYTHTLSASIGGNYTCTVANNKPSTDSASLVVAFLEAVQDSLTSIQMSWKPLSTFRYNMTGCIVNYMSEEGDSGKVTVSGSSRMYALTGLKEGGTYIITANASFNLTHSVCEVTRRVHLWVPFLSAYQPHSPYNMVTIIVSYPSDVVVDNYTVEWERDASFGCSDQDRGSVTVDGAPGSYDIQGLEEGNRYRVIVVNGTGSGETSNNITILTKERAPSSPPNSVSIGTITSNTVTILWDELSCRDRNGNITGYTARAINQGRVEGEILVNGGLNQTTISGLTPSTQQFVQVAAINGAGTGPYSSLLLFETKATLVGLEKKSYTVSEPDGAVSICINAEGTNTDCPSSHPFQAILIAKNHNTGGADYEVEFAACQTLSCVNVTIADDLVNEPDESLTVTLTKTPSFASLTTVAGKILILDNDDKPEGVLVTPVSATSVRVSWSGSTHLTTSLTYTVSSMTSGSVMSQNTIHLLPGVNSTVVSVKDDLTLGVQYQHKFSLFYVNKNYTFDPEFCTTTTTFSFDKAYFQIQFSSIDYCVSWGKTKTADIDRQLREYLTLIIRNNCSDCEIMSHTFLRTGLFLCRDNPTITTYRSTIVNPFPTTNSSRLVDIIQSWVSTTPSLVLDGLLMRVVPSCPTVLTSLDETECVSSGGRDHDPGLSQRITQTLNECALRELGDQICDI